MFVRRSAMVALVLGLLLVSGQSAAREEPRTFHSRSMPEQGSLWVPVDALTGPRGEIRWEILRSADKEELQAQLEQIKDSPSTSASSESGPVCDIYVPRRDVEWDTAPVVSLQDLIRNARVIAGGRVERIEEGLLAGAPRSLLFLSEPMVLKQDETSVLSRPAIVYPEAAFELAGTAFCSVDPRFPDRPRVGDRVLVFQRLPLRDLEGNLLEPLGDDLFIETVDGSLVAPPELRDDPSMSEIDHLSQLIQLSEALLGTGEREEEVAP